MVAVNDLVIFLAVIVTVCFSASAEQDHRYVAALFARGQRKSRGTSADRSHVDTRFLSSDNSPGPGAERDVSWTHKAFRAFHEMRAGRPSPEQVAAFDGDSVVQVDHEQFRDITRKLVSVLSRFSRTTPRSQAEPKDAAVRPPPASTCWHLRGRLTNTVTGRTIALVEGVELSRNLAFEINSRSGGNVRQEPPCGAPGAKSTELELDRALKSTAWTAFGALATSKFFMYQDPDTGEPMDTYRNTPVDKRQPVRTYERFSQVVAHILQPNGRILLVSEWGGRSVKAETVNANGVEEVGSATSPGGSGGLARDRETTPRRVFNLQFFVEARTAKEEREMKRRQSRPGPRWVAFGSTPPRSHGCREAYTYVHGGDVSKGDGAESEGQGARTTGLMSYTRFGECPSWYGVGRTCSLDLQGRRIDSFSSLPSKLRRKVLEVEPGFDTGPPATLEECRALAAEERDAREERRRRRRRFLRPPFGVPSPKE